MNQRPVKTGYLRQQMFLGMWKTYYFYLEGTQFLIFEDDKTHIPMEKVDLNGFIVDGIWQQDGYYSFLLRHIQNEIVFSLLAFTNDDAQDWVNKLKQAIILSEYESLIYNDQVILTGAENNMQQASYQPQQLDKEVSNQMKKQLEFYSKLAKDNWIILKSLKNMKLLQLQSQHHIVLKGEYIFNGQIQVISDIIQKGEQYYDLFNPINSKSEVENVFTTQWHFKYKGKYQQIQSQYLKSQVMRHNYFIQTKESINDIKNKPKNVAIMNKILDIIHIVLDNNKCCCNFVIVINLDKNAQMFRKFIKEQLINFSVIINEYEFIQQQLEQQEQIEQIQQINNNNNNINRRIEIEFAQSRLLTISDQYDNNSIQDLDCDNIHFPVQDREGYQDRNLDQNHPAFIYSSRFNRINQLNEEQLKKLEEFKYQVKHLKLNDNCLIRYLIARNYNVKESKALLLQGLEWRKKHNINSRKLSDCQAYIDENIHFLLGYTKWGHPILYTAACNSHPQKIDKYPEKYSVEGYERFHTAFLEDGIRRMRGQIDQFVVLIDCYNFSMKNFSFSIVKSSFLEVMLYYPERQYKVLVINSDFITRTCYKLLKPFIPQRTNEKIKLIGQDFKEIKECLLEEMDIDIVPKRYGGNNVLVQ